MNPSNACDPSVIAAFLDDELDDRERETFQWHLEQCSTCRGSLERSAADDSIWSDARTFLNGSDADAGDALTAPAIRLDFLQPTDDPRMLGRLGTHEICGVIGSGGMGIVLKAFDASLNRYVALKVLSPHLATSGAARRRFAREAQAAAAVVHDNVIAIYGVQTDGPIPYLIMPYVKGESLQRRIERQGPLELEEILRIGMQVARGLSEAHDQGLIHRDIKPANILLPTGVERVLITDFGLARTVDDATLTRSGVIAGTPQFMSPEQAKGDAIDTRTDLFSLGSVLYTMAAGRPPFRAETPYGIIRKIVEHSATPLQQIDSRSPAWLQRLIDRLHAKRAGERIESAAKAADLLENCLAHVQNSDSPLPAELSHPPRRRRRQKQFALAAGLSLACGLALWATFHQTTTQEPTPPSHLPTTTTVDLLLQDVESEIEVLLAESEKE